MTDDDAERRLREALDSAARASVGDQVPAPPPRFVTGSAPRHRGRLLAPLAAAAAVVAIVFGILGITNNSGSGSNPLPVAGGNQTSVSARPTTSRPTVVGRPVHVVLQTAEGASYGVGMPVIAYFSAKITSAAGLAANTTATVNGKPVTGAWYFLPSTAAKGYPIEGHFRLQNYWPAHAEIEVAVRAAGLPAGPGFTFANDVNVTFTTGPADLATVNDVTHRLTLTRDGKPGGSYPVSLGEAATPTSRGIKVIMEKGVSICMKGPGYDECGIKYTQRLTYGGEYLHSAPWNVYNIEHGIDSSNGCTNLLPADAQRLYDVLQVGDVVDYPNASGPKMKVSAGYGDWNVSWTNWQKGGLVPTG